jgi:ADP-heptose:LPS heptosyltransferase
MHKPARIRHPHPRRILVIKLGALGDFVQAVGPMRAIRAHHRDAHITLLTTPPLESLGRACGLFDDIIALPRPGKLDIPAWLTLRAALLRGHYARVYDLQNNDRTALYLRLFPQAVRPDWVGAAPGAAIRNNTIERTAGSAFAGHVQTLAMAGVTGVTVDDLSWMTAEHTFDDLRAPYILLVPGASPGRDDKRWPREHYAAIARMMNTRGFQSVIIGAADEGQTARAICAAEPAALDLTGRTALGDIPALARGAAAAIGNDTGPMHMIAPTGCPALVLFSGASDPARHAPLGAAVHVMRQNDIAAITADAAWDMLQKIVR